MEHSGLISMLRDDKIEDLKRMYNLFGRVSNGHATMREMMSNYIKDTGKTLVMDEEKQKEHLQLIQSLLDLKEKYDKLLLAAFNNDKLFIQTLNQVLFVCEIMLILSGF
jgi:cullin 3